MAGDNFDALRKALDGFPSINDHARGGFQAALTRAVNALLAATDPDVLRALLAERDALQAKVEAMEKDAGRYAWLREVKSGISFYTSGGYVGHGDYEGDQLDTLIDSEMDAAARAQPTGEKP